MARDRGHNSDEIKERLFAARGHHCLFYSKVTNIYNLSTGYYIGMRNGTWAIIYDAISVLVIILVCEMEREESYMMQS